jgi:hypothetical protein
MITLEDLADGTPTDRNFQRLRALVPDTGGVTFGLRLGVTVVTFTAAAASAVTTVDHGLGKEPVYMFTQAVSASDFRATAFNPTSTQFDVKGFTNGSFTGDLTVYWQVWG